MEEFLMKANHAHIKKAIEIWEKSPHYNSEVSLKNFIGVFYAVYQVFDQEIKQLKEENQSFKDIQLIKRIDRDAI